MTLKKESKVIPQPGTAADNAATAGGIDNTIKTLTKNSRKFSTPTGSSFASLIDFCGRANNFLGINDGSIKNSGLSIKNDVLGLNLQQNGGLEFAVNHENILKKSLKVKLGAGFNLGNSLGINLGPGFDLNNNEIGLKLATNSGIDKDFKKFLVAPPLKVGNSQKIDIDYTVGLEIKDERLQIMTAEKSGLWFEGSILKLKLSKYLCIKDGALVVNIDIF